MHRPAWFTVGDPGNIVVIPRVLVSHKLESENTKLGAVVDIVLGVDIGEIRYGLLVRTPPIRIQHCDFRIEDLVRGIRDLVSSVVRRDLKTLRNFPFSVLHPYLRFDGINLGRVSPDGEVGSWVF